MPQEIPTYNVYTIKPLSKIEQEAKDQAIIDMWIADEIDWDNKPFIDWSTCFDINNIRVAV